MNKKTPIHIANRPKAYEIKLGDYILNREIEFVSLDLNYSIDSPIISGKLVINDVLDINRKFDLKNIIVSFKCIDLFDEYISKEFVITNIIETEHKRNEKALSLTLQDVFSYTLSKSFISKSFYGNPTKALSEYMSLLELELEADISVFDEDYEFCIPSHIDNLTAFQQEFEKIGYLFYQTRDKIVAKHYSELLPGVLPYNGLFADKAEEQYNKNLIHDIKIQRNNRKELKPKTRSLAFNIETKQMEYNEENTIDDLLLNDDDLNIQDDLEFNDVYQTHLNFDHYRKDIKNSFIKRNSVDIVVGGYKKNDLHQVYELKISGIKTANETIIEGNAVISGKYISTAIADKLFAGSLIQLVTLNRADERKVKS